MIDEDMLYGMAQTYCAKHGMAPSVGDDFGKHLVDIYEGSEWSDLGTWHDEWEGFCLDHDRSVFDGLSMTEVLG